MTVERPRHVTLPVRSLLAAALLAAIAASLLPARDYANAQIPTADISGRVVNGTAGASPPEGMEVALLTLDESAGQIVARETTTTGPGGRFSFSGVARDPRLAWRVIAIDGEFTPSVDLDADSDWAEVEVVTYERTKSLDDISVTSYSLLIPSIDARARAMGVLGAIGLRNDGDTVWIPDLSDPALTGLQLVRFSLPRGYTGLSVESDLPAGNVMEIGTGFALSTPVPPGEFNILMTFTLNYEGDGFDFPLNLPFGGDNVRLMLPDGQGAIAGDGLGPPTRQVVGERAFTIVTGEGFDRGSRVSVSFSKLPVPSVAESVTDYILQRPYVPVLAWLTGIVLIGLFGYALVRALRGPAVRAAGRRELVLAIAELDERYSAGQVDEDRYLAERAELKRRALQATGEAGQPGMESRETVPPP